MQHSPMLNSLQAAIRASANPYEFPERASRYHQTHLQGNLCSLWKQSHSKNLLGTPNTAPYSRMGCNSLQDKAGLCCSPLHSNVQVGTVLHSLLSSRNTTTVKQSLPIQFTNRGQPHKKDGQILIVKSTGHTAWKPAFIT